MNPGDLVIVRCVSYSHEDYTGLIGVLNVIGDEIHRVVLLDGTIVWGACEPASSLVKELN